jgi:hypothetical protein
MPRTNKTTPRHRVYLTLEQAQHDLLEAFAAELGRPPATLAGQFLTRVLEAGVDAEGRISRDQIEATIRTLRGEPTYPANVPRWRQPLPVILAERDWWATWYPELCKLLSRHTSRRKLSSTGVGDGGPVLDSDGYFDLLEFLFPALRGPRGTVTWRSPNYPTTAERSHQDDGGRPLKPAWESVIRHVVVAMTALEEARNASLLISVEDQIRHGWLSTLLCLVGEAPPGSSASPRLPMQPLVQPS